MKKVSILFIVLSVSAMAVWAQASENLFMSAYRTDQELNKQIKEFTRKKEEAEARLEFRYGKKAENQNLEAVLKLFAALPTQYKHCTFSRYVGENVIEFKVENMQRAADGWDRAYALSALTSTLTTTDGSNPDSIYSTDEAGHAVIDIQISNSQASGSDINRLGAKIRLNSAGEIIELLYTLSNSNGSADYCGIWDGLEQ